MLLRPKTGMKAASEPFIIKCLIKAAGLLQDEGQNEER